MYWISIVALAVASLAASVKGSGTITFGSSVEHISVNVSGRSGRASFEDRSPAKGAGRSRLRTTVRGLAFRQCIF